MMNATKTDYVGRKWIQLAEERVHRGFFVSAVFKLPVVLLKNLTFMAVLTVE